MNKTFFLFAGLLMSLGTAPCRGQSAARVDLSDFRPDSDVAVGHKEASLRIEWTASATERASLVLNLEPEQPLITELGVAVEGGPSKPILRRVDPVILLTVGERDLDRAGWTVFFDNPPLRSHRRHRLEFDKQHVRVASHEGRTIITIEKVSAGSFRGTFQFTLFRRSPLIFAEAVVKTAEMGSAILYDAGLVTPTPNTASSRGSLATARRQRRASTPRSASRQSWRVSVRRVRRARGGDGVRRNSPRP